jgi:hypothetical protein
MKAKAVELMLGNACHRLNWGTCGWCRRRRSVCSVASLWLPWCFLSIVIEATTR